MQVVEREDGASEGIRTLDTHVGNVMLYQAELRSLPEGIHRVRSTTLFASDFFQGYSG